MVRVVIEYLIDTAATESWQPPPAPPADSVQIALANLWTVLNPDKTHSPVTGFKSAKVLKAEVATD